MDPTPLIGQPSKVRMMEFHGSSMSIMVMIMCLSVVSAAYPFKISEQEELQRSKAITGSSNRPL